MSVLIAIPARYASSRFPAKPLAPLKGATGEAKSLIQRSWEAACKVASADRVVVATDHDQIAEHVTAFGGEVVMTSPDRRNGTERCAEVAKALPEFETIVNFQGDAPLTPPWFIEDLIAGLSADADAAMATPVLETNAETLAQFQNDRKNGRVGGTTAVLDPESRAIYFSKEVLPYTPEDWDGSGLPVYHHVGAYAFRRDALLRYLELPETELERREGLEQLRFVANRLPVRCVVVEDRGHAFWELNNPEDVPVVEDMLQRNGMA
ncbi:MAG: manno-octulosonate cytidylyltransferase [Pseudomonadota bacterium]